MTDVPRHQARHKQLDKNTNMSGIKFSNVSHSLWGGIIDCELYLGNGTMPHSTGPLNGFYSMIYQSASPHKLISITQSVSGNRKLIRIGKILEITAVKSVQLAVQSRGLTIRFYFCHSWLSLKEGAGLVGYCWHALISLTNEYCSEKIK